VLFRDQGNLTLYKRVYRQSRHGVRTRTVLDFAVSDGTLPGALLRTPVAQKENAR